MTKETNDRLRSIEEKIDELDNNSIEASFREISRFIDSSIGTFILFVVMAFWFPFGTIISIVAAIVFLCCWIGDNLSSDHSINSKAYYSKPSRVNERPEKEINDYDLGKNQQYARTEKINVIEILIIFAIILSALIFYLANAYNAEEQPINNKTSYQKPNAQDTSLSGRSVNELLGMLESGEQQSNRASFDPEAWLAKQEDVPDIQRRKDLFKEVRNLLTVYNTNQFKKEGQCTLSSGGNEGVNINITNNFILSIETEEALVVSNDFRVIKPKNGWGLRDSYTGRAYTVESDFRERLIKGTYYLCKKGLVLRIEIKNNTFFIRNLTSGKNIMLERKSI